jgi:hypothetical protein
MQRATADYLDRALARQDEFFRRVRVDEHVTRIGNESYGIKGLFYLSVPDMNRFGILNVAAPANYAQQDLSALVRRSGLPITYLALEGPDACASSSSAPQASLFALAAVVCGGQSR